MLAMFNRPGGRMLFVSIMTTSSNAQRNDEAPYLYGSVNLIELDVSSEGCESRSQFQGVLFDDDMAVIARVDILAIPRRGIANQPIGTPQGSEAELVKAGARHAWRIANNIAA